MSTGAGSSGGGNASALAAIHYESLAAAAADTTNSLWAQLQSKLPEIRNAAHYYANEAQKVGTAYLQGAAAAASQATGGEHGKSEGAVSSDHGRSLSDASGEEDLAMGHRTASGTNAGLAEVHYQPFPNGPLGISVGAVHVDQVTTGDTMLGLCIANGFAVFEVTNIGVFEKAVELSSVPKGGPVIAVQALTRDIIVVLTEKVLVLYSVRTKSYGQPFELKSSTPASMKLMKGGKGTYAVVSVTEFAQLCIFELALPSSQQLDDIADPAVITVKEHSTLLADNTVFAVSQNWIAYSSQRDDTKTEFISNKAESTAESAAKTVMSGISAIRSGLWGTTPSMQPQAVTLGTVAIYDVQRKYDISCFGAHNHSLQCLRFDPSGTLLATASTSGTSVNVFQIMPSQPSSSAAKRNDGEESSTAKKSAGPSSAPRTTTLGGMLSSGPDDDTDMIDGDEDIGSASGGNGGDARVGSEVALVYRLIRGMTKSKVTDLRFGPFNAWVGVCTSVGTCHFYTVPTSELGAYGRGAKGHPAPSLNALCRARSAPTTTPVNPSIAFSPIVQTTGTTTAIDSVIATGQGTVSYIRCTEDGAHLIYTKSIDAFSGPRDENSANTSSDRFNEADGSPSVPVDPLRPGTATAAQVTEAEGDEGDDALWRAHIELVTHEEERLDVENGDKNPNVWVVKGSRAIGTTSHRDPTSSDASLSSTGAPGALPSKRQSTAAPNQPTTVHPDDEWEEC